MKYRLYFPLIEQTSHSGEVIYPSSQSQTYVFSLRKTSSHHRQDIDFLYVSLEVGRNRNG